MSIECLTLLDFNDPSNLLKDKYNLLSWQISGSVTKSNRIGYFKNMVDVSSNAYIQCSNVSLFTSSDDYTFEYWGTPKQTSGSDSPWFEFGSSEAFSAHFEGTIYRLRGGYDKSGSLSPSISKTDECHLAVVFKQSTHEIIYYINGIERLRGSNTQSLANRGYMRISAGSGSNNGSCTIDAFGIFKGVKYTSNFTPSTTNLFNQGLYVQFPDDVDGTYTTAPNKLKYYYKVSFIQSDTLTETRNVVNYETTRILSVLRKILIINILYKYIRSLNF